MFLTETNGLSPRQLLFNDKNGVYQYEQYKSCYLKIQKLLYSLQYITKLSLMAKWVKQLYKIQYGIRQHIYKYIYKKFHNEENTIAHTSFPNIYSLNKPNF